MSKLCLRTIVRKHVVLRVLFQGFSGLPGSWIASWSPASSFDFGYVLDHTAQIRTIVRISVRVFRFCNHFGQTYMLRTIVRNMPRNGQGAHIRTIVRILGGVVV